MKKQKLFEKQFASLFLVFCMVISLIPKFTIPVHAEENKVNAKTIYCDTKGFENNAEGTATQGQKLEGDFTCINNGAGVISVEAGSGNKYVRMQTLNNTGNFAGQYESAAMNSITGELVVEFDITTSSKLPNGNLHIRDTSKVATTLVSMAGNKLTIADQTVDVETGKWIHLKFVCNVEAKTFAAYVDNAEEPIAKDVPVEFTNAHLIRFMFDSGNTEGTNMLLDNFLIYDPEKYVEEDPTVGDAIHYNSGGYEKEEH